jgi:CPA2 family monovalent cation:H+ antiporter-2
MTETHGFAYLQEVVVFLVAAGVAVPLMHRLRIAPVLGYLMAGVVVGPFGLGVLADRFPILGYATISDLEGARFLADLGVVFLLFMIGLELSPKRLWALRRLVFGLGALQVAVTASIVGLIAWGWGNTPRVAILLGAGFALSSTAMVMQILTDRREVGTTLGRSSFSILLFQDLAVVPVLVLIGVLGTVKGDGVGASLLMAALKAVAVIGAILLAGHFLVRPLYRMAAAARSRELFMAMTLLVVIGTAASTEAAGLSMTLGAFLAGLLLAETEYVHEIEVDIEPFKGLLMGLFFMTVGMGVDFRVAAAEPFWIPASVVGLFVIKALITAALCLFMGVPRGTAVEAGLLLGQGGEFAFVIVGLGMASGIIPPDPGRFMLIITSLSMLVTPAAAVIGKRAGAWVAARAMGSAAAVETPQEGHVIIAGFGRVGRTVGGLLDADKIPWVALDRNPNVVADHRKLGRPVLFGGADRMELLRRAGADRALALVVTMDDPRGTCSAVAAAKRAWPDLPVFARARDNNHAAQLEILGVTDPVPETTEASLTLAGRLLTGLGIPAEAVVRRLEDARAATAAARAARNEPSKPPTAGTG